MTENSHSFIGVLVEPIAFTLSVFYFYFVFYNKILYVRNRHKKTKENIMTNEQLAFLVTELTRGNPHYSTTYQEVMQRLEEVIPSKVRITFDGSHYVEKNVALEAKPNRKK